MADMAKTGSGLFGNEFKYEEPEFRVTNELPDAAGREPKMMLWSYTGNDILGMVPRLQKVATTCEQVPDATGREPKVLLWCFEGNDILGLVPRLEKVSSTCEKLMGGDELYHYHTKIMMKDAKKGGSFEWHQDYGYWYKNGNLRPDLISMFLAVDPCIKENGGLQVLVGSHNGGRVDHTFDGGQQGADKERVEHLKKIYPHYYFNIDSIPGDCILFHCNLLHSSGPNDSAQRRWAFNCSYNKRSNNPVKKHHHPFYHKLDKGKEFVDPATDETVKAGSKGEAIEAK
ncbi:PROHY-like protein [Mya arenaria]|uniref:PROHY-like protein n=1 Tax=Mya arenaria TaxID=6604 RepID=A0ABY7G847_MYAAR|nr:PROHY-like protein [Mya arenaria]